MSQIVLFEETKVRRVWSETKQKWVFAIVDVVAILTQSVDSHAYWRKLKERLKKEGNETVTSCHALKMTAADGKQRLTDVADTEQLLRLIQSIPSPKAEPFKLWLARVGTERLEEIGGFPACSRWLSEERATPPDNHTYNPHPGRDASPHENPQKQARQKKFLQNAI